MVSIRTLIEYVGEQVTIACQKNNDDRTMSDQFDNSEASIRAAESKYLLFSKGIIQL